MPEFFVDFHPEDGNSREMTRFVMAVIKAEGWKRGYGFSEHRCGHCGHHLRYAAVMFREDVKEIILVGQTCDENRFDLDKGEFQRLRDAGKLNAERRTRRERMNALYAENPSLVWLSYLPNIDALNWSDFLGDLYRALNGGWITEKQIAAACKSIDSMSAKFWERENEKAAKVAAGKVSTHLGTVKGKIIVSGIVRFIFEGQSFAYYGPIPYTFVIEDENGNMIKFSTTSATLVDGIDGPKVGKGDKITVAGTVKAHVDYRGTAQTVLTRVKAL